MKSQELKGYDALTMVYSYLNGEIWIGDKKGVIHILNEDFSEKEVIEKKHNHSVVTMTISRDGEMIASGDSYRYIYVFHA
jgi:hypothetical protein